MRIPFLALSFPSLSIFLKFFTFFSWALFSFKIHAEELLNFREAASFFAYTAERIQREYVEPVESKKLLEGAVNGMLSHLDANSGYLSEESYQALKHHTQGEYGGLGIEIWVDHGFIRIASVMEGTPAHRAHLKADDWIMRVDGKPSYPVTASQAIEKLQGKPGTSVTLTIRRRSYEPVDLTLVRETINIKPVKWSVFEQIGYIRLLTFNEKSPTLVKEAIEDIKTQLGSHFSGLILDVRNNSGGLFPESLDIADLFLKGQEIVSTQGRNPGSREVFVSKDKDIIEGIPMVVLINGVSASASEIVAGALQDNRRALLIGTKSFGKGSVQSVLPLTNGGAIKITTARYYTPSGRSIDKKGIIPDIIFDQRANATPLSKEDFEGGKFGKNFFPWPPENEEEPRKIPELGNITEDYQLQYAVKVLKSFKNSKNQKIKRSMRP